MINEIIINRGNCQISQQNKYEINKNKLNEYFQKNPKNFILYTSKETSFTDFERKIINVKMKNGNMASLYKKYYDYAYHSIAWRSKKFGDVIYSSNKKDSLQKFHQESKNNNSESNLARFDSLDDEIKALFKKVNIKVVLAYGKTPYNQYEPSIECYFLGGINSIDDIQDDNKIKKCIREQTTITEYELIEEKAKEYAYKYSDNLSEAGNAHSEELFVIRLGRALKKQDGSLIGVSDRSLNANDDKTMTYINSLDNESRSVYDYKPIYPMGPIDFGKILAVPYECSPKEVLEVILKTNGGDFKYMFEQN